MRHYTRRGALGHRTLASACMGRMVSIPAPGTPSQRVFTPNPRRVWSGVMTGRLRCALTLACVASLAAAQQFQFFNTSINCTGPVVSEPSGASLARSSVCPLLLGLSVPASFALFWPLALTFSGDPSERSVPCVAREVGLLCTRIPHGLFRCSPLLHDALSSCAFTACVLYCVCMVPTLGGHNIFSPCYTHCASCWMCCCRRPPPTSPAA